MTKVRRTIKRELLLQLGKNGERTEDFRGAVGEPLGKSAYVAGLKGISNTNIVALRRTYGEKQIAIVSLNAVAAAILLKKGRIRIGWVICRIRERNIPTKCYRCMQFGHMARQCDSIVDRSGTCRKCGEPNCMFFKVDNPKSANHIAGSGKCPQFSKALKSRSRRRG